MGFIYAITSPSGKSYIGQTARSIGKRFEEHQRKSSGCVAIYSAIKKYGWENFEIDYYEVPDEELNKHERWMVNLMGTLSPDGYNLKEGGGNGKMSEEIKQKMKKPRSEETKQKMRKPKSEKHKQNMREARLGMTASEETKQKLRKANLGKTYSEETKQKQREAKLGKKRAMKPNKSIAKQRLAKKITHQKEYINTNSMARLSTHLDPQKKRGDIWEKKWINY